MPERQASKNFATETYCFLLSNLCLRGDNLQFYPNFALFSALGVMKLDHYFFHVSKLSEDPKKGLHRKLKSFYRRNHMKTKKSPNIIQRSDADHSQIIWENIPHIPLEFRYPCMLALLISMQRLKSITFYQNSPKIKLFLQKKKKKK